MDLELHLEQLIAERRRRTEAKRSTEQAEQSAAAAAGMLSSRAQEEGGQKRSAKLVALNWSARLTIILIGTCLLFSTFFALEFFIAKLSSILITDAQSVRSHRPTRCAASPPLRRFERIVAAAGSSGELTCQLSGRPFNESSRQRRPKFEYGLVFESELPVSSDQQHYELGSKKWPISAQLRLSRLLEAHQAAMPFDPDIWRHSEPHRQMHLLWGNLSQCSRDLEELLRKLSVSPMDSRMSGLERQKLQQLLDSFGRPESGSLMAHPFWLGSYLQCQQLNLDRWPIQLLNGRLETRYCVGKVVMNSWPILDDDLPARGSPESDEQRQISFKVGLCLPKSCDSLALFRQRHMNEPGKRSTVEVVRKQVELLMRFNFNPNKQNGMNVFAANEIKLNDIYCLPLEESRKLSSGAYLLLFVLALWLLVCVSCTCIRWRRLAAATQSGPSKLPPVQGWPDDRLLEIMAIDVNFEQFLSLDAAANEQRPRQPNQVNLDVLDSVKHLGCIGVIGAHVFLTYLTMGTAYSHIIEHIGKDLRTMLLLSLNNLVDTFFVISGLLASYLMLKRLDKIRTTTIKKEPARRADWLAPVKLLLRLVFARYLRMAPLYFLVYAATKLLATHLGSGPLWDYATNGGSLRGLCQQESWLWPLTFLSNFRPIAHHCVPPAWSLAVDLQFFLLMPLFMLALRRWPSRWSYSLIGLLVCLSTWSTFANYHSLLEDSFVSLADFAKLRLHVFAVLIKHSARGYSQPQNRMGPILIGVLGGHLLHRHERQQLPAGSGSPERRQPGEKVRREWPQYMRGKWFQVYLLAGLLFVCAPAFVRLRDQARSAGPANHQLISWLLQTSTSFDSYLALLGFVLIKPLWSVCNLLVFLRLCTDLRQSLLGRLMSLGCWRTLSKLNYAILLVHFEFIAYEAMSRFAQTPISWPELLCKFSFAYVCSLLASVWLHVLVERPAQKLAARYLLGEGQAQAREGPKQPAQ